MALVGPSGAGKTTTAMLVPRIADASTGTVSVDGHDVRDLTLESLRDAVGFVMQDPHLFHETIRENLRYARPDATDDELVAACKAARINELIVSLPDGYDTLVGERGYRMSGGEKQRLAIARDAAEGPRDRDPRRSHVAPRLRVGARDPTGTRRRARAAGPRS